MQKCVHLVQPRDWLVLLIVCQRYPLFLHRCVCTAKANNRQSLAKPGVDSSWRRTLLPQYDWLQASSIGSGCATLAFAFPCKPISLEKAFLCSRVHVDSTSLRECTAKGEGCASRWRPFATGVQTWIRDDYGAYNFKTTSSNNPPWHTVVRRITKDLDTGEVPEVLVVSPSEQQFYYATVPDCPRNIRTILLYLMRPVAPRERSSESLQSVYVSSAPMSQLWAEI